VNFAKPGRSGCNTVINQLDWLSSNETSNAPSFTAMAVGRLGAASVFRIGGSLAECGCNSAPLNPPRAARGSARLRGPHREAEQYAIYPERAACIRALGGLPARCDFGPPAPDLVAALVSSASPILRALDRPAHAAAA
jgi:hypothetical protein